VLRAYIVRLQKFITKASGKYFFQKIILVYNHKSQNTGEYNKQSL